MATINGSNREEIQNSASYMALVSALRRQFSPMELEVLQIRLADQKHRSESLATLSQAVTDAWENVFR